LSKEIIMNAKALFAVTVVVALLSSGAAMASEATQFKDAPGTLSRTQVQADLARARADGTVPGVGENFGNFHEALTSVRGRDEVRAEARAVARSHLFVTEYSPW
jgi:Domain of unknown function (DUF4148)